MKCFLNSLGALPLFKLTRTKFVNWTRPDFSSLVPQSTQSNGSQVQPRPTLIPWENRVSVTCFGRMALRDDSRVIIILQTYCVAERLLFIIRESHEKKIRISNNNIIIIMTKPISQTRIIRSDTKRLTKTRNNN